MRPVLQSGAEILVDDFDPEAHAKQTLEQKAEEARNHAARMLQQTKVCLCSISGLIELIMMLNANANTNGMRSFVPCFADRMPPSCQMTVASCQTSTHVA